MKAASRPRRGARARLALRIGAGLAGLLMAHAASAFEPFVVRDIRIDGAQRTEAGTVFGYLPIKVGELLTEDKAAAAVRALYATGFFKDVRLEADGSVLVVYVEERPIVASIEVTGAKEFDKDTIKRALRDGGLAESRIFDRSVLERGEQELKRQYLARGKYAVRITTTVTPLERNRVGITIAVEEGESAKIRSIRITGNQAFTEKQLLDQFQLTTPTWLSWYTKSDQYAREKLTGDLERLRSYYLDRGYLEFALTSTQVAISPTKEDIYLAMGITEGGIYRVNRITFSGQLLGREEEFAALMQLREGETFSGKKLADSQKAIVELLGTLGFAFANVNPVPEIDRDKREVSFNIMIDPGRRVYVRRISVSGNARTRDEVIRRELRQYEDAWYDADKIRLSRERLQRTGYFKDVRIETAPVADTIDQVDLSVIVVEQPTGSLTFGLGLSSVEKVIITAGINQQNFLGTGKSVSLQLNSGSINRTLVFSLTDPYYTDDGVSRTFDLFTRNFDAQALGVGDYTWRASGGGVRWGIPYTEIDRLYAGLTVENNQISLGPNPPLRYVAYVDAFGDSPTSLLGVAGWRRDTRDSAFAPTRGRLQNAGLEFTLWGDVQYWKAIYNTQWFFPLTRDYTLALLGDVGLGRPYGGNVYPFFKNFYAGGIGSVRGFQQASLGPRDPIDNTVLGGQTRLVASAEFIFPLPGTGNDRSFRSFVFLDAGNVWSQYYFDISQIRYSTGIGLNWASPFGPLKLSFGYPINRQPQDKLQSFQFQVGTGF